jgi:hypothetical protein
MRLGTLAIMKRVDLHQESAEQIHICAYFPSCDFKLRTFTFNNGFRGLTSKHGCTYCEPKPYYSCLKSHSGCICSILCIVNMVQNSYYEAKNR